MTWDEAFAVLEPLSDWPKIRVAKLRALFELSRSVCRGCIVELGTFRGLGAIALALGAKEGGNAPVYTIDNRTAKRGWAGEPYGPEDARLFEENVFRSGVAVTPVVGEVREIAATWTVPVGLVVWDLGIRQRLEEDFHAWKRHVSPQGFFAVKDIESPGFGREQIVGDPGWELDHEYLDGFIFVYRCVLDRRSQPSSGGHRER
jgi:methyltransferase family protein